MSDRPFGVPQDYDECPFCKQSFRRCEHSYELADKAYLRTQMRKVLAGKKSNGIARVVTVDGINLFLWHDGKVTWDHT